MTPSGYARIAGFWSHPLDNGFSKLDTFMGPSLASNARPVCSAQPHLESF